MKIQKFPEEIIKKAEEIAEFNPAIIAGGAALSRIYQGFPLKDVDLFIPGALLPRFIRGQAVFIPSESQDSSGPSDSLRYHLRHKDVLYDLIYDQNKSTVWDVLQGFDIGLAKCGYVLGEGWIFTDDCLRDMENYTLTRLQSTDNTAKRLEKYLNRLGPPWRIAPMQEEGVEISF